MNDKDCTKCGAELVWIGSVMGGKMCCPRCTVPSAEAQALANTAVTMPGSAKLAEVDFDDLLAMKPGPLREADATLRDAIVYGVGLQKLVFDPAAIGDVSIDHIEAAEHRLYTERVKGYFEPQEKVKGHRQGQTAVQALEGMHGRDPRYLINEAQRLLHDMFLMQAPAGTAYKGAADRLAKTLEHLARELHRR